MDLATLNQSIIAWLYCGTIVGGVLHAVIAVVGFVLLAANRELPDVGD